MSLLAAATLLVLARLLAAARPVAMATAIAIAAFGVSGVGAPPAAAQLPTRPGLGEADETEAIVTPYEGKRVDRLVIEGNERITEAAIRATLRTSEGEPLRAATLDDDVKRLYELGFYEVEVFAEPVSEEAETVTVRFRVSENSRIARVTFVGLDRVERSDVPSAASIRAGDFVSDMILEVVIRDLEDAYHEKGFLFVDVRALKKGTPGGLEVTFRVHEGPRVRVDSIKFVGNRHLTSKTIRRILQTKTSSWIRPRYLDRAVLEQDIIAIRNWYRSEGYRDVEVELGDVWFNQARDEATLTILVDEGPRYRVRNIRIEGNTLFDEIELRAVTDIREGDFLEDRVLARDRARILRMYRSRAYIDAKVVPRIFWNPEEEGIADLVISIDEGDRIYMGKIRIEGNRLTSDKVIRRQISLAPGDPVDYEEVRRTYNRLAQSGYFSAETLRFEQVETEENLASKQRDFIVHVDESQSGWIRFALGVGSNVGVLGEVTLIKRNFDIADLPESFGDVLAGEAFTGAGQTLSAQISPGTELSRFRLAFREPFLFDTKNSLDAELFRRVRTRFDWVETRTGTRFTLGRYLSRFNPDLELEGSIRAEEVLLDDFDRDAPQDAFDWEGRSNVMGIGPRLIYRQLDAPIEPTTGIRAELGYEFVGHWLGGDVDMNRVTSEVRTFFPLYEDTVGRRHVLSFWTRLGWSEAARDTDSVPTFERFFAGGRESIRGFEFRGVGPFQEGEPVGGQVQALVGTEYGFPMVEEVLRGVLFLDSGTVAESVHAEDFRRFRLAWGFGFRLRIPFLGQVPLALDFGFPIFKEEQDERETVSFSLGAPFFGF